MMRLTRTGIGLLTAQYRSVLKKCFLINAGLFLALAPNVANAVDCTTISASSSIADIAACVGAGKFTYSDASGYFNGWNSTALTPSKTRYTGDDISSGGYYNYSYQTISKNKSILENLELIDRKIGSFPVQSSGYNWNYINNYAKSENRQPDTVVDYRSIDENLILLDYVVGKLYNGNNISRNASMGDNLKLLDTAIGAKQTGTYITGSDVYSNLKTLDTQVAANTSTIAAHTAVINALDNNYYRNIKVSRVEKLKKTSAVIVRSAKHDVTIFGRKSDKTALCSEILQSLRSFRMTESVANDNTVTTTGNTTMYKKEA